LAICDQVGWAGGPALIGFALRCAPFWAGLALFCNVTVRSGDPASDRIWNDPFCSFSCTCAAPLPVFLKDIVWVVVVPSTCVEESEVGVITR